MQMISPHLPRFSRGNRSLAAEQVEPGCCGDAMHLHSGSVTITNTESP